MPIQNLAGRQFDRLRVLGVAPQREDRKTHWTCECSCGAVVEVRSDKLKGNLTRSCGCLNAENLSNRNLKDGQSFHPLGPTWSTMIARCYNPKHAQYAYYGGRGISVSPEWRASFSQFVADMGDRPDGHSIDRIDNNGNYCAKNCRWATGSEQYANTRRNIRHVLYNGNSISMMEAVQLTGLRYGTLRQRLLRGLTGDDLFAPAVNHAKGPRR